MDLFHRLKADVLAELPPVPREIHDLFVSDKSFDDPDRPAARLEDGVALADDLERS